MTQGMKHCSWWDYSWNPFVGCSHIPGDPSCGNCYAQHIVHRYDWPTEDGRRTRGRHEGVTEEISGKALWNGKVIIHPYDDPVEGRDAVVRSWLGEAEHAGASSRDEKGTYDAAYRAVAVDGDVAVAVGSSSYLSRPGGPVQKVYDNCFVMRFDSAGRCRDFAEWYVQRPGT